MFLAGAWQDEQTGGDFAVHAVAAPEAARREDHGHERRPLEPARARDPLELDRVPRPLRRRTSVPDPGRVARVRRRSSTRRSSAPARRRRRCPPTASTASPTSQQARAPLRVRSARARPDGERRRLGDAGPAGADASSSASASGRRARRGRRPGTSAPTARCVPERPRGARRGRRRLPARSRRAPAADASRAGPVGLVGGAARLRLAAARRRHGASPTRPPPLDRRRRRSSGPGSVDLWLRSSADGHRPPGDAQRDPPRRPGDLRAERLAAREPSEARPQDARRELDPRPTHLERDAAAAAAPASSRRVRVGLFAVGARLPRRLAHPHQHRGARRRPHALGASTRRRPDGLVVNEIARSASRLAARPAGRARTCDAPPALPPCPGLRGQPCRTYVPAANGG